MPCGALWHPPHVTADGNVSAPSQLIGREGTPASQAGNAKRGAFTVTAVKPVVHRPRLT